MDIEKKLEKIESLLDETLSSRLSGSEALFCRRKDRNVVDDGEIDIRDLWNVLLDRKWVIIGVTLLFAVTSVLYALSLADIYKSEALLAPAEERLGGGLARMAGSLGGLAGLAGINLGDSGSDKTIVAIEVLKSREFISEFIRKNNLMVPLMAAKGWDSDEDTLILDEEIYNKASEKWVRNSKPPRGQKPTFLEAYEQFIKLLHIYRDEKTGLVNLSVEHYSPSIAKAWVDMLILDINQEVKQRDVAEANRSIDYLSSQLRKTSIADMKAVFYELIEEQTKTVMFAEVREEYVFKTIDRAVVPEVKAKPKRAMICVIGILLGGIISIAFVLLRHFIKK